VNAGNADFCLEAWCDLLKRIESAFVEISVTTDTCGGREGAKFIRWGFVAHYCTR